MVEALDAIEIALVDRVDAQEAGAAVWMRLTPLSDVDPCRACVVMGAPQALLGP